MSAPFAEGNTSVCGTFSPLRKKLHTAGGFELTVPQRINMQFFGATLQRIALRL